VQIRRSIVNSRLPRYTHRNTMTYSAVLFDLDGTLLDTLEDIADSMNAVLDGLGYAVHDRDAYRYFVGDGVENLVRRTVPENVRMDEERVRSVATMMRAEYGRRWKDKTRLYGGIPELLDGLLSKGIRLAILSNKPHAAVLEVVDHFFGKWHFDAALGARPGVPIKPDAGAALEVCRNLALPPAAFLYLGDTNTDMATAIAAGMYPVGALWGFRPEEELRASGALALASHPGQVLDLV
jgi:phosphoglycolate phosphatase